MSCEDYSCLFYRWLDGQLNMDFKILCISRSISEWVLKSKLSDFIKKTIEVEHENKIVFSGACSIGELNENDSS